MLQSKARRRLAMLGVALVIALPGQVLAADHVFSGRITDNSGRHGFKGAEVRLRELGRSAVSDADGRFRFDDVPSGQYTVEVAYVGAPARSQSVTIDADTVREIALGGDVTALDNVLVVGYVAGQAAALSQQRSAENFKNVISADAVGQFPDQNVAEAVQRVPGVSITRDQGEGRFIVVRGIDPNLNAISIAGVRVPSAESDARQVAMDVIPSELLSGIEINKSLTPDMDGDGIGASIDVKTLTAFDRGSGPSATAKLEGGYNQSRSMWSPKGAATFTDTFDLGERKDAFGIALGASWQNRRLGTDGEETKDGWSAVEGADGNTVSVPASLIQRRYRVDRRRQSGTANLDWRVSDTSSLYLHTLLSDFRDTERREQNRFRFDQGELQSSDRDSAVFEDGRIDKSVKLRQETQRIQSYALGGQTLAGDWTADYEVSWSKASESNHGHIEAEFQSEDQPVGLSGLHARRPSAYALDSGFATDPANYLFDSLSINHDDTRDVERAAKLDLRRDLDIAQGAAFVKFGGKLRRRHKDTDVNSQVYDADEDMPLTGYTLSGIDYRFGTFGPGIAGAPIRDFTHAGLPGAELNEEDSLVDSRAGDFRAREDIDAGYLMGGYQIGAWDWVGGVRVESTAFRADGMRVLFDADSDAPQFEGVQAMRHYRDVLPQLNVRYDLSERALLRAAVTRSVARPNFADLSPGSQIEVERDDDGNVEQRTIVTGNPRLDPYRADNLDLAYEFYPGGLSAFSAGVFYKRIRDFVVNVDLAGQGPYAGYDHADTVINGDTAKLYGLELSWTQSFAENFLLNANTTWSNSRAQLGLREGAIPLPNQSKLIANLVLGYQTGPLQLRLSNSWRSRRLSEMEDPSDPRMDIYESGHLQMDLSAKYQFAKGWRAYLEAINLTDRPYYRHYATGGLVQYEKYGRVFNLGVEANF
jgi:TonB-dependent receptor